MNTTLRFLALAVACLLVALCVVSLVAMVAPLEVALCVMLAVNAFVAPWFMIMINNDLAPVEALRTLFK